MVTQTNLEIRRGDTHTFTLSFVIDSTVLPIIGYKVYFTVKRYSWLIDDQAAISIDITDLFDPAGGIAKINLVPNDTKDLDPGIYLYDIQIRKNDLTTILTILNGELEVLYDITRRTT